MKRERLTRKYSGRMKPSTYDKLAEEASELDISWNEHVTSLLDEYVSREDDE